MEEKQTVYYDRKQGFALIVFFCYLFNLGSKL